MVTSNVNGPFRLPTSYTRRQYTPISYTLVICGVDPADGRRGGRRGAAKRGRHAQPETDRDRRVVEAADGRERHVDRAVLRHRERIERGTADANRRDVAVRRSRSRWRPSRRRGRVRFAAGGDEQGQSGCRAQRGGLPARFHKLSDARSNEQTTKHGIKTRGCRPRAGVHPLSTSNSEIWFGFFAKLTRGLDRRAGVRLKHWALGSGFVFKPKA